MRVSKERDNNGHRKVRKSRRHMHDSDVGNLDWKDLEYEISIRKTQLVPVNVVAIIFSITSGFFTINELIAETWVPYVYIMFSLLVAFYLIARSYILTVMYAIMIVIYCLISIGFSIIFIIISWTACTSPICSDSDAKTFYFILMAAGLIISIWYLIQGVLTCKIIWRDYLAKEELIPETDKYLRIKEKKIDSRIAFSSHPRSKKKQQKLYFRKEEV